METLKLLVIGILLRAMWCQDHSITAIVSHTARLPCGSTSRPFPDDAIRVYWSRGTDVTDILSHIMYYQFSDDTIRYFNNNNNASKYNCSSDRALTVAEVTTEDEGKYTCFPLGSNISYMFIVDLKTYEPPSNAFLEIPDFQENVTADVKCNITSMCGECISFTITFGPDYNVTQEDVDQVIFETKIARQRRHNGQNAICIVLWKDDPTFQVNSSEEIMNVNFQALNITMTESPDGLVNAGTKITFTCVTDEANPTATVTWTVDDVLTNSTSDETQSGSYNADIRQSVLILTAEGKLHNKIVRCVVSENTTVNDEKVLTIAYVNPPLNLTLSPNISSPIQSGTSVTFTCDIDANPAPSYSIWTNGGPIKKWMDVEENKNSFELLLQKEHNREDLFCIADGNFTGYPVNSTYKSFTVQFSATSISMAQSPSGSVIEKTDVTFTCVTDEAEPTAEVVWTVAGSDRTQDSSNSEVSGDYNAKKRRSELIVSVNRTMNGETVECHVKNSTVRDTMTLDVTSPSQIVSNTTPSGGSFPAVAVGAVMAVLVIIIAIVIGVVIFLRLKRNRSKEIGGNIAETPYEDTGFNLPLVPSKTGIKDDQKSINSEKESDPALPPRHGLPPVLPRKSTKNSHADKSAPALPEHKKGKPTKNISADKSIPALPEHQKETRIPKDDFGKHYAKMVATNKFKEEFDRLPTDPVFPTTYGALPDLKKKNRFKNMLPYDCNRVVLSEVGGNQLSSYINASFIKSYNGDVAYIATIGCTKESMDDFWRMMWEENASVIVMVTNLKEKGKTKCEKYWPDQDVCERYGSISVILEKTNYYADYEVKYLSMEKDNERREVTHYHYTGWPDKDVPRTAAAILKIRDHVKEHRTEGRTPIVVHCSAGIGRTGTFISIDYLLDQVEAEGVVDVVNCVTKLRDQRHFMVQTEEQYRFVYQVLSEAISVGSTALPCSDLGKLLFTLISDGSLEKQFQVLQVSRPVFTEEETEFATLFGNDRKNRSKDIVPTDENRVLLESFLEDYINAVYIDGYKSPRSYIVTQIPMDLTLTTFWRMMMDHKCAAIVCLQDDPNSPQWCPQDNKSIVCGPFLITNSGERRKDGVLMSAVTLALSPESENTYANVAQQKHVIPWDKDEQHNFKVFHVTDWTKQPVKERSIPVLRQLYSQIQQWQHQCDNKRVVLMCLNGADECGLAVAAFNLFDMANTEQEVDIFNLVKQIRLPRPQFIASSDQYIFLHEAVQEYISQFGTYSNFR